MSVVLERILPRRSPDGGSTNLPLRSGYEPTLHRGPRQLPGVGFVEDTSALDEDTSVLDTKESIERKSLAFNAVRKGRAAELVGTVVGPQGELLDYTGLEGYHAGLSPQEIVDEEIKLGEYIIRAFHIFARHEASHGVSPVTFEQLKTALFKREYPPSHVGRNKVLIEIDSIFKDVLSRAGATAFRHLREYASFKRRTYTSIANGYIDNSDIVPNPARISIDDKQKLEAYLFATKIGYFGRKYVRDEIEAAKAAKAAAA